MSLQSVPLHDLRASHLQALIDNQVSEGLYLEFKRDLPGNSDADRREFLADASSFANSHGGDMVFGMEETNDVATALVGIEAAGVGSAIARLEGMLRDGLAPRVLGIRCHQVALDNGRSALVVRIPRSLSSPHMVTFGNLSRFFGRVSRGKYQLDVREIRTAFLRSETALDGARTWRLERISRILGADLPIPLCEQPRVVVQVMPLAGGEIDLGVVARDVAPKPLHSDVSHGRYNLDGLLYYSPSDPRPTAHTYLQVFRSGALETVAASLIEDEGQKFIRSVMLEQALMRQVERSAALYEKAGIGPPFVVMIALLGVRGFRILPRTQNRHFSSFRNPIEADNVLLPEVVVETLPVDAKTLLRPLFDILWQAGGWSECDNFDDDGNYLSTS